MKDRIKEVAKEKGISINRLEQDAGIAKGAIAHWDDVPKSIETLTKIADILGTTVDELIPKESI